jgi:hypothetical protein
MLDIFNFRFVGYLHHTNRSVVIDKCELINVFDVSSTSIEMIVPLAGPQYACTWLLDSLVLCSL